jgi:cobalt-zinc-cadmium efflux system outer membrane protein
MRTESIWKPFMLFAWLLTVFAAPLKAQGPTQNLRLTTPAPAAPGLTLEQLLQMARTGNPTLGQAQAGIQEAAGRTLQAGLWPNPTVGYSGDEIRGGSFGGGEQGVFIQQSVILGGKLGLDRKIFAAEGKQTEAEA